MSACRECGGPLGRGNQSGFCKRTECQGERARLRYHALRASAPFGQKARTLLGSARGRAKRGGLPFDLTLEWVERELASALENGCPLLGIEILLDASRIIPGSPTIDKFNPERGYTQRNCWVISHRANSMKQNATPDFLRRILEIADSRFAVGGAVQ